MPISTERCYDEIESSTETLAGLVDGTDLATPVPTCPDCAFLIEGNTSHSYNGLIGFGP